MPAGEAGAGGDTGEKAIAFAVPALPDLDYDGLLVEKLRRAVRREAVSCAVIAGGVAANRRLRRRLEDFARDESVMVFFPDLALCTDNAAMIAGLGYRLWETGLRHDLSLDAHAMTLR